MNKKITKKTNQKNETISNPKQENINIAPTKKLNFLKKIAYITIILHFILQVIIIYYDNKIPWLTQGINNILNLIKSIIPGGTK